MKLKKWVTYVLVMINVISVMFMASDWESMMVFHLVHLGSFIIFVINTLLIVKYGNKEIFE